MKELRAQDGKVICPSQKPDLSHPNHEVLLPVPYTCLRT